MRKVNEMKQTIFKSAFGNCAIQEDATGFSIWQDEFSEYDFIDVTPHKVPKSFEEAKKILESKYGKVKLMETRNY